ncbi:N-acetyltransferase [Vulcanococcus limneticus]|uniref:N-acetyltransferase n=1 Tax=Vulcanococcus limneticus TaxID=2170428 RepID=UPI00398C07D6
MLDSLLIPFRSQNQPPALPQGYAFDGRGSVEPAELNALLVACGEPERPLARLEAALARSAWQLCLRDGGGQLVGFARVTSDLALNANIWDLTAHPAAAERDQLLLVLVHAVLARLRRELPGCSISLSAPPEALQALQQHGFVVDPGGIRAMGLQLPG